MPNTLKAKAMVILKYFGNKNCEADHLYNSYMVRDDLFVDFSRTNGQSLIGISSKELK